MRSRRKIIDATLGLIESEGFAAVTIAAVAEAAEVSRQTIYSIFGSREALVSQSLAETAQDGMREVEATLESCTDAADFLVELVVAGRAMLRAHPALASLIVAESGNPLFDQGMMPAANAVMIQILAGAVERESRLGPVLDEVAEVMTRTALSVILFESERIADDHDLRTHLQRWLLPALAPILDGVTTPG